MTERRSQGSQLVLFVLIVFALAATSIVWWTFAGQRLSGMNTNLLLLGEVAFQFLVIGVPLIVLQRRRRRRAVQSDQP